MRATPVAVTNARPAIGVPGDVHEREADRIADRVMRMAGPRSQPALPGGAEGRHAPRLDSFRAGGQRLPGSARAFLEPRFRADFGAIRIHRDDEAARAAGALGARAFTSGRDLVFGSGQYRPATAAGRRLLAHELVHTLQQDRSSGRHPAIATPAGPPGLQRSAVASFTEAGFEEQSDVVRQEFEDTLYAEGRSRERKKRRFEKRLERLDPEHHAKMEGELEQEFGDRPRKLARKRKRLERRKARAERKLGALPVFESILDISVTYHYVKSQMLPDGQVYYFTDSVLEAVRKKFRVGQIWKDLDWGGKKIGVRFDIRFQAHKTLAEVQQISGETPGDVPMVGKPLAAAGSNIKEYDYTQDPPLKPPPANDKLGEASYKGIAIDTEAMREEKRKLTYYRRDSDPAAGKPVREEIRGPSPEELDGYMASVIAHEIGHNIGMIHKDVGIMAGQTATVKHTAEEVTDNSSSGSSTTDIINHIKVYYPNNPVTRGNVKLLIERIPEMTQKKRMYWKDERKSIAAPDQPSKDSGFTVLQDAE